MLKKRTLFLVPFFSLLLALSAFAAVDVNTATEAELDGIQGLGPSMTAKILTARQQGEFKNWQDFSNRVSGVKGKKAAGLSRAGLTVKGEPYKVK